MLVSEAAKKLDMSTQTLRMALRQGKFPFGEAIKTTDAENSKVGKDRWTYYINEDRLNRYLKGGDYEKENCNSTNIAHGDVSNVYS